MAGSMLLNALTITNGYLVHNYSKSELDVISGEIETIWETKTEYIYEQEDVYSYEEVQEILSNINEKEKIRKSKGVYYTPTDIVEFILVNSVKMACGELDENNIGELDMKEIPYDSFCYEKTVYDPTCGAGVFLLAALEKKLDLLDMNVQNVTNDMVEKVVATLKGNDVNKDSIAITKIRLLLSVLHRYGVSKIKGLSTIMDGCFTSYDFVSKKPDVKKKYDIIIGNPPYVEDSRSVSKPAVKYGNIYANVLDNSAQHLKKGGVMGFVIPLSYVSTPRMKKIRDVLYARTAEQYILSYSDRPDCLFTSVHQKLCVLFGRNTENALSIHTGNYRYWYREERGSLFSSTEVVANTFAEDGFIPKLGNPLDSDIYRKIAGNRTTLMEMLDKNDYPIFLNMRAAFWIKAFLEEHEGSEYKKYMCQSQDHANFCMCLLNSSLFWWYWICISDCWHITRKELTGFRVPGDVDFQATNRLANELEQMLEDTKVFVGTKQTDYEYKHKECVKVIHKIDDHINALYGLTDEESVYIKNFSYRYRIGGGAENGCD